jgi:hypothetical protein
MRNIAIPLIAVLLVAGAARGQTTSETPDVISKHPGLPYEFEGEAPAWEFSLAAYTYIVPHQDDYVQPTLRADRDWLHLEARYNYEGIGATSLWFGGNFSFGQDVTLDVTPMIGGVFGGPNGIAPGYELTLEWRRFALYSESEMMIDTGNISDSYFYTWSELTYSPLDWLRVGVLIQRTKAYSTDFDIQHGLLVGATWKQLDLAFYALDFERDPVFIVGVTFSF